MKKIKQYIPTNKEQEVASDILKQLFFCNTMEDIYKVYDIIYKNYQLKDDPFTKLPCSNKEWAKNSLEYDKQAMMERYGHYDGLE